MTARITAEPLTQPMPSGATVLTPRGYGTIVSHIRFEGYRRRTYGALVVELDDNAGRCVFMPREVRVVTG